MKKIQLKLSSKQIRAYKLLTSNNGVTHILYGGSAGSGKSWLGCIWLLTEAYKYPNTQWVMARSVLARLKESTLVTLQEVAKLLQIPIIINLQSNYIKLNNGSKIILKELIEKPSNRDFDSLGGLEIAGAFIDEVSEVTSKAVDVLTSRIRKNMPHKEPKLLMSCNPTKGWLKTNYYDKFKNENLDDYKQFIQALPTDNRHLSKSYLESLSRLPTNERERLLYGNWEYADDSESLFSNYYIANLANDIEYDDYNKKEQNKRIISVDVASGVDKDRSVYMVWEGLTIVDYYASNKDDTVEFTKRLIGVIKNEKIRDIVIDADGIGSSVIDQLKKHGIGAIRFNNNGKVINKKNNYENLKTECYYEMSINQIQVNDYTLREELKKELEIIKKKRIESNNKISLNNKTEQKRLLGYSPDFADCAMMRFYFMLQKSTFGASFVRL